MILAIVGPTGVGKTRLSIALAQKYQAIIINCDAMQVYKNMNIGTAKVTQEEMMGIKHYLLDFVDVKKNYTVYDYQKDARQIIKENKAQNIIIVGGTGLYLKAALYNYVFLEDKTINNYENFSNEELYALALKKDANLKIHINNRQRLIRFLNKENITNPECNLLYPAIFIGLTTNRDKLYEIINKRVDKMFEEGLVEEVKSFLPDFEESKALKTAIGYKEIYSYLKENITLEEAKELIKKNSRHYAKRQYTFFNNQLNLKWFEVNFADFNQTINQIEKYIEGEEKYAK